MVMAWGFKICMDLSLEQESGDGLKQGFSVPCQGMYVLVCMAFFKASMNHLASFVYLFLWLPGKTVGHCTRAQVPNEEKTQDILHIRGQTWVSPFTLSENEVQSPDENWNNKSEKAMAG